MKTPKFKGRKILEKTIYAEILGGSFGKAVNQEIQDSYGEFSVISCVKYDNSEKQVVGSTPFYVTAVNEVIRPIGLRTMTVDDAYIIRKSDVLDLRYHYEDIACVVRSLNGKDEYFSQKFVEGIQTNRPLPITTNLCDCCLDEDDKSEFGLVIKPTEEARIISGDIAEYKGDATFSRLCLYGNLDLYSAWSRLAVSDSAGRVVVVKEEENIEIL